MRREEDARENSVHVEDWQDAEELTFGISTEHLSTITEVFVGYREPEAIGGPGGLLERYFEMARDAEREREAEEWSEGLIGDALELGTLRLGRPRP